MAHGFVTQLTSPLINIVEYTSAQMCGIDSLFID